MPKKVPITSTKQKVKTSLSRYFSSIAKFLFPKKTSFAILNSLIISGVFCCGIYAFAIYAPGDTLDPACNPTDPNCTVTSPVILSNLSSTATGLTYANTTGVFSLTSGYVIPTTTEQTNWNAKADYAFGANSFSGTGSFTGGDIITKGPWADVRAYGATGDGVTDDTAAVQAALNASLNVYFPVGNYVVSNLTPRDGQHIFGTGTSSSLKFKTGSTGYMFEDSTYSVRYSDLDIDGGNNSDQSATSDAGTRSAIHMSSNLPNNSITNVSVHGFDNIGIGMNGVSSQPGYPGAPYLSGVNVYYNYVGIDTGVGNQVSGAHNGAEYIKITNITSFGNRFGIIINSGNITISESHFDGNGYGVKITDAYNGAHGTITGCSINHNLVNGFYIDGTNNGFTIVGNQNWYSNVYVNNSTGINFQGNTFGNSTFSLNGGGTGFLKGNWFPETPTITHSSDKFVISENYYGSDPTSNSANWMYGKLGLNYNPNYSLGPNGIHVYVPSALSGTSTANSVPISSNVAIMTSTAQAQDIGGVLGLGGMYQTTGQTYSGVMYGGLKGGKLNSITNNLNGYLGFYTNNAGTFSEKARIDNLGNLGIGTTSPSQLLSVGATNQFTVDSSGNVITTGTITGSTYYSGATAGVTCSAGNVSASTLGIVTACTSSDSNLKTNVAPIGSVLDKLNNIGGIYYDWNQTYLNLYPLAVNDGRMMGMIAQDVESQFPELVATDSNGYKEVRYSMFTAVLLEGIKELNQKVDEITGVVGDGTVNGVDTDNSFIEKIKNILAILGIKTNNGSVESIQIVSPNGTVYCTWIDDNGEWQKVMGDCDTVSFETISSSSSSSSSSGGSSSSSSGGGDSSTSDTAIILQAIAITTPATKLSYTVGDALDITGLVVTGTYSDSSTKEEIITSDNVTGFDSSVSATSQILTITVNGQTTTYAVDIVSATVVQEQPPAEEEIVEEQIDDI